MINVDGKIVLTTEEINALKILSNIECDCFCITEHKKCPLYEYSPLCITDRASRILERGEHQ